MHIEVSTILSVAAIAVSGVFSYLSLSRSKKNDQKQEIEKDQADIVALVRESMSSLNGQLKEIKDDVRHIRDEIKENQN